MTASGLPEISARCLPSQINISDRPRTTQTEVPVYATEDFVDLLRGMEKHCAESKARVLLQSLRQPPVGKENNKKEIQLSYYPQDPSVGGPEITTIPAEGVTAGPDNSRIDTQADVKPDENGDFIAPPESPDFVSVQTFACSNRAMSTVQGYLGRKIYWLLGKAIILNPDRGETPNAFYDRDSGTINFFHFRDKKTGGIIFTGNSMEIVAHETGHALLDSLKPHYLDWTRESMAIHEAFGDVTGMLTSLQNKGVTDTFLRETGGDFRKENVIARMGEQMGLGLYARPYTKLAINSFTYSDPLSLPEKPPPGELGGESHSFSQVLVGAVYDIMEGIFTLHRSEGLPPEEALAAARDAVGELFYKGVDCAPQWNPKYRGIALGMLNADEKAEKGKYRDILLTVFRKRKILKDTDMKGMNEISGRTMQCASLETRDIKNCITVNRFSLGVPPGTRIIIGSLRQDLSGNETRDITFSKDITLEGPEYGPFSGASLEMMGGITLSKGTGRDVHILAQSHLCSENAKSLRKEMKEHIKGNRIKLFDKTFSGKPSLEDLLDENGKPYIGYAVWEKGRMKIVRSPVIA
jgi:hypothetical protein